MIQQVEILGVHAFFARDGVAFTIPSAGTVSRTAKPGASDASFYDLGTLDIAVEKTEEEFEHWKAAPGVKQLEDVIPYKRQIKYSLMLKELGNISLELLFGTLVLANSPSGTLQFNPLELGAFNVKGWLKMQYYGRAATNLITVDHFVALKYEGSFEPGDANVEPKLVARGLRSTLNTGLLL